MVERRASGFTLIEAVVVILILSIIAVMTVPRIGSILDNKVAVQAHELAANLKLMRDMAMSTGRHTWVVFDTNADSYTMYIESPTRSGRSYRIPVADPVTGDAQFSVSMGSSGGGGGGCGGGGGLWGHFRRVSFDGSSEVEFDRLGQPCNGNGTLLGSDGTVVLSGDTVEKVVTVVAKTGMVCEN